MKSLLPLLALLLNFSKGIIAQCVTFDKFQGTVYDIPGEDLSLGFSKYVQYYDVLGKVTLDSLSVPRSNDIKLFPGVYQ
ncbi:MAG: hypothetical protein M3R25_13595, partial [Bacteroidota bacterium]|nr:hypothetical protein [Bacteroidota bacterium]